MLTDAEMLQSIIDHSGKCNHLLHFYCSECPLGDWCIQQPGYLSDAHLLERTTTAKELLEKDLRKC